MRPFSEQEQKIWAGLEPLWDLRMGVERANGTFLDFCNIVGEDWVKSMDWGDSIDGPGQDLNLTMAYRRFFDNASPFISGNRFSDIIQLGRRIIIQARLYCDGLSRNSGTWHLCFDGTIEAVNPSGNDITITAVDRIVHELQRAWIQEEVKLGADPSTPALVAATIIDVLIASEADHSLIRFRSENTPSFAISEYNQQPMSAADAIKALVDLIGWTCRPTWRADQQAFGLTLEEPARQPLSTLFTVPASTWRSAQRAEIKLESVRNRVQLYYIDGLGDSNQWVSKPVVREDAVSIATYGARWMEVREGSTSPIDSLSEAQNLADIILADLKDPPLAFDCELSFFPWCEVNDFYTWGADGLRFGASQDLAVYAYRHSLDGGTLRTLIQANGKPTAGRATWLEKEARPGLGRARKTATPEPPPDVHVESSTQGPVLSWAWPRDASVELVEVHRSDNASFTPDATTLVELVKGSRYYDRGATLGDLAHYKIRVVDRVGNVSQPTPALTASSDWIHRDVLEPAIRKAIGVTMSADQSITSGDRVAFDTYKFGDAGLHDAVNDLLEPDFAGLGHVNARVLPGGSSEAVTWELQLKSAGVVLATSGTQDGDRPLVISEVLEFDSSEVLELAVLYSGSNGQILASGSSWSVVASPAGGLPSPLGSPPVATSAPLITGSKTVGQTLSVTNGGWSGGTPTYNYQWRANGQPIGTDQNTYDLQAADAGKFIDCIVTASTTNRGSAYQISNRVGPVQPLVGLPELDTPPTIVIGS